MSRATRLLVTLDVERDYGPDWRTPGAVTFASVTDALPRRLWPLCAAHGVRPTLFLSPEVLLAPAAVAVLTALPDCELGAHLHAEYVPPGPRPATWCDPSLRIAAMQGDLAAADERARLATLTELFAQQCGRKPTSFRAGRFGAGPHTGAILADLGYAVDSSVTPGVCWRNAAGEKRPDYRALAHRPYRVAADGNLWRAGDGPLLEVPITIVPRAAIGRAGSEPAWLRPWFSDKATLLAILDAAARDEDAGRPWRALCMMFHSMELVAGASPYPQTDADVQRYLADLDAVFARARQLGFAGATISEFEREFTQAEALPTPPVRIDAAAWTDRAPAASELRVALDGVDPEPVLAAHGVQPWMLYSFQKRAERWDNCLAYDWVRRNVPADGAVLDVGCGAGFNLFWLHERGHRALSGCDLDGNAIAAARDLAARTGREVKFWVDDGRTLHGAPARPFAALCAMNWIQLVDGFNLDRFLVRARALLADSGVLVFDFIDRAFERNPDHRWLTSDWSKPSAERRPSEYRTRFALPELRRLLQRHGFAIEQCWHHDGVVPRGVVACRRVAAPATRPRVLYVVDAAGWAHERKAQNLIRCLDDRYDGRIVLQERATAADLDAADLVVVFYWRQLQSMPHLRANFERLRPKLLLGICSHNELEGEFRGPGLALLRRLPRAVFTHSRLLETGFRALVGDPAWCLPNGVDAAFFTPAAAARRSGGPLRVGWAGSVANFGAELRGLPNVIEPAVASLTGVELCIAAREERLRTPAEMRAFYRSLDVYVCASRVEGTPNPCLEAAACGVPIVSTAVGNMPELIRDGHNGFLVAREPAAFAAALATLRDDESLRPAMAANIRADIERDWDWRQRAEGFATLFAAALAAPRGHEHADCCVRDGDELLERGDRIGARTAFQQALDADGNHALAHARLAAWWWNDAAGGAPDAALTALGHQRQALALGRDDPAVREAVAGLLQRQGRADLATALGR